MAGILIGRRAAEIRRKGLDLTRGFGILKGWELEDVEDALGALLGSEKLRLGRKGPWKGKLLHCSRKISSTGLMISGSMPFFCSSIKS